MTGLPPDLDRLRVFGNPSYVHVEKQLRRKLDDRAWIRVFVGYALDSPAYLLWNLKTRRLVRSRIVELNERAVVGSTVIGERMSTLHKDKDYDDNDDVAEPIPHEESSDSQSG